jgi:hypothetical protein
MDAAYAPDGIRAFYGVFLKWAFWQTGRFKRRSGYETPLWHDPWIIWGEEMGGYSQMTWWEYLEETKKNYAALRAGRGFFF